MSADLPNVQLNLSGLDTALVCLNFLDMEVEVDRYSDGSVGIYLRDDSGGNLQAFRTRQPNRSQYEVHFKLQER